MQIVNQLKPDLARRGDVIIDKHGNYYLIVVYDDLFFPLDLANSDVLDDYESEDTIELLEQFKDCIVVPREKLSLTLK